MITRIAPTPSGFLHQGNLFNFLLNWLWARANGGKVLLRIDDADTERKRMEYVEDIFRVLEWLGMDWDMGPSGPDALEKEWSQVYRRNDYDSMLQLLIDQHLIYACTCSRQQLKSAAKDCTCKEQSIPLDYPTVAWKLSCSQHKRFTINEKNKSIDITDHLDDFVVRKKDGWPAYPITSLADDLYFGVTHIARGSDLMTSTLRQLYISSWLPNGNFQNVQFWHHDLLMNEHNEKLSKSAGAQSSSILHSTSPQQLIGSFVAWMGWEQWYEGKLSDLFNIPDWKNS